jgi:hypothetical protein
MFPGGAWDWPAGLLCLGLLFRIFSAPWGRPLSPPRVWGARQTEFGPENVGNSVVSLGCPLARIGGVFERNARYIGRLAAASAGADRALTAWSSHVVTN